MTEEELARLAPQASFTEQTPGGPAAVSGATWSYAQPPAQPAAPVRPNRGMDVGEPGQATQMLPGQQDRAQWVVNHQAGTIEIRGRDGGVGQSIPITPDIQRNPRLLLPILGFEGASAVASQLAQVEAPTQRRPQQPAGQIQVESTYTRQGTPTAETAAALGQANEELGAAQGAVDVAEQNLAYTAAGTQQALAEEQQAQQQMMVQAEQERQNQIMQRMQSFDDTIRRVQEQRIDPEGFFGGDFGRRMGAGIIAAIGQFAAGLTGGENTALGIINGAIERNLRSQEMNMQNARQGAALEGQALAQFRQLLGDDRAAEDAARAAALAATVSRLDGMIATARADQVGPMQRLRDALAQQQGLAQQAAAERAANTFSVRRAFDMRVSPAQANPQGFFAQQLMRNLPEADQRRIRELEARDRADRVVASGSSPAAAAARRRIERRRQQGQGSPQGRQQSLTGNDILQRQNGLVTVEAGALNDMLESAQEMVTTEQATTLPDFAAGGAVEYIGDGGREGRRLLRAQWGRDEGTRTRIANEVATLREFNNLTQDILQLRDRDFWEQLSAPQREELIRGFEGRGQALMRVRDGFGVVNSPAEIENMARLFGELARSDIRDTVTLSSTADRILAQRRIWENKANSALQPYGLSVRSLGSNIRRRQGDFTPPPPEAGPDASAVQRAEPRRAPSGAAADRTREGVRARAAEIAGIPRYTRGGL